MLDALVSAPVTPRCWPISYGGQLRAELPALKQALAAKFKPHQSLMVSRMVAHLDYLDEAIGIARRLVAQLERLGRAVTLQPTTTATAPTEVAT